jgi:hypothetical protein
MLFQFIYLMYLLSELFIICICKVVLFFANLNDQNNISVFTWSSIWTNKSRSYKNKTEKQKISAATNDYVNCLTFLLVELIDIESDSYKSYSCFRVQIWQGEIKRITVCSIRNSCISWFFCQKLSIIL